MLCIIVQYIALCQANTSERTRRGPLSEQIYDHDAIFVDPHLVATQHERSRREGGQSSLGFQFRAFDRNFAPKLRHMTSHFTPDFYAELITDEGSSHLHIDKTVYFSGFDSKRHGSRVIARLNPIKGTLHATIFDGDGEIYRIEPPSDLEHPHLDYDPKSEGLNHIIYRRSDTNRDHETVPSGTCGVTKDMSKYDTSKSRSKRAVPAGDSCTMWVNIDQFFVAGRAGGDPTAAAEFVIDAFAVANAIFRDSTFLDGSVQVQDSTGNVRFGIAMARLTIYTTDGPAPGGEANPFVDTTAAANPANTYLSNLRNSKSGNSYGLVHAWTHQNYQNVLGLAYVGVTCASGSNAGITTTRGKDSTAPTLTSTLVFGHEVGHNWGMSHDQDCPDEQLPPPSGYFLMSETAVSGSESNNDQFSECSRKAAGANIVSGGASCFEVIGEFGAVCGNGIPEIGELCDCGYNIQGTPSTAETAACEAVDPCCSPQNCQLKSTATCSPLALYGSVCCAENCQPISAALDTIDGASNTDQERSDALCRSETDCSKAAYCLSSTFTWSNGSTIAAANEVNVGKCLGIDTVDVGDSNSLVYAKEDFITCNDNRLTCIDGSCTGSLCNAFTYTDSDGLYTPEPCELPAGPSDCEIACKFERNSNVCASTFDINETLGSENIAVTGTQQAAGTACRAFTGYCNSAGVCETVSADNPIDIFSNINYSEFVWDNWYIILALELGFIGLFFALRWTKHQQDTKAYVNSQVGKMRGGMNTMMRKQLFKSGSRRNLPVQGENKKEAKAKKRASVDREFQQLAYLIGEAKRVRRKSRHGGGANEAMYRLKALFPEAEPQAINTVVRHSPHEEAAVARLLVLGYQMKLLDDYKALTFAAKRARRAQQAQGRQPGGRKLDGYLQVSPRDGGKTSVKVPMRGYQGNEGGGGAARRTQAAQPTRGNMPGAQAPGRRSQGPTTANRAFDGPARPANFV